MNSDMKFTHATDGAVGGDTNNSNLVDTECTDASKDVVLVVTHGLNGVNGATSTIMK